MVPGTVRLQLCSQIAWVPRHNDDALLAVTSCRLGRKIQVPCFDIPYTVSLLFGRISEPSLSERSTPFPGVGRLFRTTPGDIDFGIFSVEDLAKYEADASIAAGDDVDFTALIWEIGLSEGGWRDEK